MSSAELDSSVSAKEEHSRSETIKHSRRKQDRIKTNDPRYNIKKHDVHKIRDCTFSSMLRWQLGNSVSTACYTASEINEMRMGGGNTNWRRELETNKQRCAPVGSAVIATQFNHVALSWR